MSKPCASGSMQCRSRGPVYAGLCNTRLTGSIRSSIVTVGHAERPTLARMRRRLASCASTFVGSQAKRFCACTSPPKGATPLLFPMWHAVVDKRAAQPHVFLCVATLDNDPKLRPALHIWTSHDVPWLSDDHELPRYPEWKPGKVPQRRRARTARCRASFFHWRKEGSPLTLQQHHDEPGRLRVAGVAPHGVNIGGPFVERLPGLERDGRFAFQLHDDLAFEHVDEGIGVVPMDHVLCARRIRHLNHATLLARVVREIDREQFLHVCGFGRNGCEHQECCWVDAEVKVRFLHTLFLSAS